MKHAFSTPRPVPFLESEATFSHKKSGKESRPKSVAEIWSAPVPPRPPVKSAPPRSRIFRHRPLQGAQAVSFRDDKPGLFVRNSHYDAKSGRLYFEQCFEMVSKIGQGSFGQVFKVKSKEDGQYYAVKRSRDRFRGDYDRRHKLEEVNKLESLRPHPNCVKFVIAWEERQHLYIQTELCEMSLKDYSELHDNINETVIWNFLTDLTLGLKNLHDQNLVHLDLKPANIFIGLDGLCKIGDFGLVLDLQRGDIDDAQEGDPKYMAPELMQGSFTKAADIFSVGITMLELACELDLPRGGVTWHQLRNGQLPEAFTQGLSVSLRLLISWMMDPHPNRRPTVDQILKEPEIKKAWMRRKRLRLFNAVSNKVTQYVSFLGVVFICLFSLLIWPIKTILDKWRPPTNSPPPSTPPFLEESESSASQESFASLKIPDGSTSNYSLDNLSASDTDNSWLKVSPAQPRSYSVGMLPKYDISPVPSHGSPPPMTTPQTPNVFMATPCERSSSTPVEHTPPMECRRGRLFDDDGYACKVVGPKNLLEMFEGAAS